MLHIRHPEPVQLSKLKMCTLLRGSSIFSHSPGPVKQLIFSISEFFYISHISQFKQYFSFCFFFISFRIMSSSIYAATNGKISFFFMAKQYITLEYYITIKKKNVFFIHSSINGHLDCFRIQTSVNKAAMNMGSVQFSSVQSLSRVRLFAAP